MKLTKGKIIAALAVVLVLAGAFFLQGEDPAPAESSSAESQQQTDGNAQVEETPAAGEEPSQDAGVAADSGSQQENQSEKEEPVPETPVEEEKPQEQTPPQQSGETAPPENPVVPAEPKKLTCTFSITCASVLNNMDKLTPGKEGLIPADGWLLAETEVEFSPGDTVFTVLQRELKSRNMHFEYSTAALYDTAYIEGICNLYEYDCGELSGWEYAVNGTFYGYGSSQFTLSDGDVVSWVYTCDLGADVGDGHRG